MKISSNSIFEINDEAAFDALALDVFHLQASQNEVYREYLALLKTKVDDVVTISQIPFLPIDFFKSHSITTPVQNEAAVSQTFLSSGTSGAEASRHEVADVSVYEKSFLKCFELFYGNAAGYCILALLPSYLERGHSSLVFMVKELIRRTENTQSGFYLDNHAELFATLSELKGKKQKTILIGVSYALLDFTEKHQLRFPELIVMETGGMKGKRKEMIRQELHDKLKQSFGVAAIHSEYGMTELLSQAYSKADGLFYAPPWMKIIIRQGTDPSAVVPVGHTGIISVIDLANIHSCSFITTQDLGKVHANGSFEVLGRMDFSDIRGCNLMID